MPSRNVDVSLWPGEEQGGPPRLHLSGLGELLSQFYPRYVGVEAVATARRGIRCQLDAVFPEPTAGGVDLARAFKQALVQLEGESGYQAFWGRDASEDLSTWTYLIPAVPDTSLPSGKPLAFALPMAAVARRLFDQNRIGDGAFSYRIELTRVAPQPDLLRPLIPALAELQQGTETARSMAAGLRTVLELARQEGWFAVEAFGAPPADAQVKAWLEEAIVRDITSATPIIRRDAIDLRWDGRAAPQLPRDMQGYAAGLRSRDYVQAVIESIDGVSGPQRAKPPIRPISQPAGSSQPAGQPACDYVFVSYAHKNADFMDAVTRYFDRTGVSYWRDDGIDPGAKWDEKLEERIANCSVFVACVSAEYQSSKYCRRELKFADLLSKPIVPVSQTPVGWSDGLRFMFQEIQIRTLSSDADWDRFRSGLASASPAIFTRAV
jgi:hypothetical protein